MRYDSEHKARTRDKVLKEAAAAIRSDGVERIGVAQIMARAGLTHGGFYAHFASKDDLVAQAVDYMFVDRYAYFLKHLEGTDPAAALVRFVDRYLSLAHRNAREQGCPIPILVGQVEHLPTPARERFVLATDRLTDGVASLLERMAMPDPLMLASQIIGTMVGTLAMARAQPDDDKAEQLLAAAAAALKERLGLPAGR